VAVLQRKSGKSSCFAHQPPGPIPPGFTGRNARRDFVITFVIGSCALLEFPQSRLCQPWCFGQFQLSFPAQRWRIPRSSGNVRETRRHPMGTRSGSSRIGEKRESVEGAGGWWVCLLRRGVKPHGSIAAWLRNLFRPGFHPNGTSNNARHRLRRPRRQSHAIARKSLASPPSFIGVRENDACTVGLIQPEFHSGSYVVAVPSKLLSFQMILSGSKQVNRGSREPPTECHDAIPDQPSLSSR